MILPCTRNEPVISTSLCRDIGFDPVHFDETIPVNCEPSPRNEPVNEPVVYDAVNALNDAVVVNDPVKAKGYLSEDQIAFHLKT